MKSLLKSNNYADALVLKQIKIRLNKIKFTNNNVCNDNNRKVDKK